MKAQAGKEGKCLKNDFYLSERFFNVMSGLCYLNSLNDFEPIEELNYG